MKVPNSKPSSFLNDIVLFPSTDDRDEVLRRLSASMPQGWIYCDGLHSFVPIASLSSTHISGRDTCKCLVKVKKKLKQSKDAKASHGLARVLKEVEEASWLARMGHSAYQTSVAQRFEKRRVWWGPGFHCHPSWSHHVCRWINRNEEDEFRRQVKVPRWHSRYALLETPVMPSRIYMHYRRI